MHVKRLSSSLSLSSSSSHFSLGEARGSSLTLSQSMERLRRDNRWKMLILVSQWRWKKKYRKFVYVGLTRENAMELCFLFNGIIYFSHITFHYIILYPHRDKSVFLLTTSSRLVINCDIYSMYYLVSLYCISHIVFLPMQYEYFFSIRQYLNLLLNLYYIEMWNNEKINIDD